MAFENRRLEVIDPSAVSARAVRTLLLCILALAACGPFVHEYNWTIYPIAENRVVPTHDFSGGGPVSIVHENTDTNRTMIAKLGPNQYYASSNHLGNAVVSQLTQELTKRRFAISDTASKSLRISVTDSSVDLGRYLLNAYITLEVTAGNGYRLRERIKNGTPLTVDRAFNGVVAIAVIRILNDPKIVAYLTGPE